MSEKRKGALGLPADTPLERFLNGIVVENPTTVLVLGMCPTLAVTTSAINGLSMGLATTFVLALSNLVISLLRKVIPDTVRIPSFIVVIASFVTLVDLLMQAYLPALNEALGVYIPLIVVNCIIMGRAEAYAGKMKPVSAFFDGIGMGLGFTIALFLLGSVREIIGAGTWLGMKVTPDAYVPVNIFVLAPGAFLVLAWLVAIMNKLKIGAGRRPGVDPTEGTLCGECTNCMKMGLCGGKYECETLEAVEAAVKAAKAARSAVPDEAAEIEAEEAEAETAAKPAEEMKKEEV